MHPGDPNVWLSPVGSDALYSHFQIPYLDRSRDLKLTCDRLGVWVIRDPHRNPQSIVGLATPESWDDVAGHNAEPDGGWHYGKVPPSLLIVDDHEGFREAVRILLEGEGYTIVGLAAAGEEAVVEAARLHPDLVLLDIQLPGIDGFATAERLAALPNPPAVVLISSREASSFGSRIEHAPVRGFLAKHELSGARLAGLLG